MFMRSQRSLRSHFGRMRAEVNLAMTLTTWLSIGGAGLDFAGAALLAYDVLYGPEARLQASNRRTRLAIATARKEQCERDLRELSARRVASGSDAAPLIRHELLALDQLISKTSAELIHWERHEHRAWRYALRGLLLLMAGFACQALSAVLVGLARA